MTHSLPFLLALGVTSPASAGVELGIGAAGGGSLSEVASAAKTSEAKVFSAAGSPLASLTFDLLSTLPVRPVLGLTSAPTFEYSMGHDSWTRPLIVADAGLAFGGKHTHLVAAGHAGYFSFGASMRITHLGWELGTAHHGLELRATWLARWAGFAGAMWVVRFG